ncbi:cyclase family protein [Phenylobacterium sp. LjRoot164]|uniref:cyclase family protein n=1 Tax=unclassified Phenylobacterium TaxID=2640670 RepID=UPI003ECF7170
MSDVTTQRLVDLTRFLDPADLERIPEAFRGWAGNLVPDVEAITPWGEGAKVMCNLFGCEQHQLPNGEGWGDERLRITTHLGTHVDAPLHYGSTSEGRPARTITDISLEELFVDGVVLDLRGSTPGAGIEVAALKAAIDALGVPIPRGGAVLIRTGQEAFPISDPRFFHYPGMTRAGTLFLAEQGAKVLGTDALGWDRPFHVMRRAFLATGNPGEIWDGHFAGQEREVFIVQQMAQLADLPPHGFKVGFFPLRLGGCSAAPARVVGFVGG